MVFRWDSQHFQFSHCPGSELKSSVHCALHYPQFLTCPQVVAVLFTCHNTAWALREIHPQTLCISKFSPLGIHGEAILKMEKVAFILKLYGVSQGA